eukprot:m.6967 g.6967  ORF g.6967 m.6967 type:complete len:123 (+) comp5534_c0_seq2:384-752(+)
MSSFEHDYAVLRTPEVVVTSWDVLKAMDDVSNVTKIDFEYNRSYKEHRQEFMKRIKDCTHLRTLILFNCSLTEDAFALAKVVATHTTLVQLDLAMICDFGSLRLQTRLTVNKTVATSAVVWY